MYCTTMKMSNNLWFSNIFPADLHFIALQWRNPILQELQGLLWCYLGRYSNGVMIPKSGFRGYKQHIAITFRASLSGGAGCYRKISNSKWKWSGFGQWWLQYFSVCTTCRRQVWDPQTLIRKIIIKHKKGFNPKKPCFKNNIFSLAKIVQDYFLSG